MTRYEELQKARVQMLAYQSKFWQKRDQQAIAAATLLEQLVERLRDDLGLEGQDRSHVYQSNAKDLDDDNPDDSGFAIDTHALDHRACINVLVRLPERTRGGHIIVALVFIEERTGTGYRIRIGGTDCTFAVVDIDSADPSTFERFSDAYFKACVEHYETKTGKRGGKPAGSVRERQGKRTEPQTPW